MAHAVVLLLVLTAKSPSEIKLAAPALSGVNVSAELLQFWTNHLAQQVALEGPRVITNQQIATLLGMERQKQLLGCADASSSCMAELANALGTDAIITGSIGRFGDRYQLNLQIVASNDAKPLSIFGATASSEAEVLEVLTSAAKTMTSDALGALGVPRAPLGSSKRIFAVVPGVLGLAGAIVGAGFLVAAGNDASRLRSAGSELDGAGALQVYNGGLDHQNLGIGFLIGGGVLLAITVVMGLLL